MAVAAAYVGALIAATLVDDVRELLLKLVIASSALLQGYATYRDQRRCTCSVELLFESNT